MPMHTDLADNLVVKRTSLQTSRLCTFSRESIDGAIQFYSTKLKSGTQETTFIIFSAYSDQCNMLLKSDHLQATTPFGSTVSLLSSSLQLNGNVRDSFSSYTFGGMFPRNLYRLLAVVVHTGKHYN